MTVFFDKGFHQQGAVAVAALEVVGQPPQAQPEGLGGQVAAVDGGPDQKAAQSDHAVQLAGAQLGVPAAEEKAMKASRAASVRAEAAKPSAPSTPWSETSR